ncbi:MAG: alpha/beta hydrolase [Hyphomicrobiaceae bacterium]|nr:alpha/beta hydrolase [Hyphomicrobiaceae bacterium]
MRSVPRPGVPLIAHCVLAPGAMGAMDTTFMNAMAALLADRGIVVSRFEFAYMAERRTSDSRRPPPRAERLVAEYAAAVEASVIEPARSLPLFIGGKSLGGRVASLLAASDDTGTSLPIAGVCCLGYPFHPPKKPENLRIAHLPKLRCPSLIVQGERDPFGSPDEVASYDLPAAIRVVWIPDGDHDLKPRRASGVTHEANLTAAADAIADFMTTAVAAG